MKRWNAGPAKSKSQIIPAIGSDIQNGLPSLYSSFRKVIKNIPIEVKIAALNAIRESRARYMTNIIPHVVIGFKKISGIYMNIFSAYLDPLGIDYWKCTIILFSSF